MKIENHNSNSKFKRLLAWKDDIFQSYNQNNRLVNKIKKYKSKINQKIQLSNKNKSNNI